MKDITVAQAIYARLKEEWATGSKRISKSAFLEWTITYVKNGKKKTANKDKIGRKARLLVEANYIGVEYENNQAYLTPPKGTPRAIVEDPHEPEEGEPEPYYPVSILKDGERIVRIVRSMEERDNLLALEGSRAL